MGVPTINNCFAVDLCCFNFDCLPFMVAMVTFWLKAWVCLKLWVYWNHCIILRGRDLAARIL